jgi:hypothetical protein
MPQEARHGNHLLLKSILQVVLCFDLLVDSVRVLGRYASIHHCFESSSSRMAYFSAVSTS